MPVLLHERESTQANGPDADARRWDEVWSGVHHMPPMPNNEHQRIIMKLCSMASNLIDWDRGDCCLPGANLSDRDEDWTFNYRVPDVFVALASGPAIDRGTHWIGGADLVVEVISPGENPHAKLDFYSAIDVREVLIVHRDPSAIERFQRQENVLKFVEKCVEGEGRVLSSILPIAFSMRRGIVIEHQSGCQIWRI